MTRPLKQHGVKELESLFAKSKTDMNKLEQLEHELQYRQVPRAAALLAEVQAAMGGAAATTPSRSAHGPASARPPTPHQPTLWEQLVIPPAAISPSVAPPSPPTPVSHSIPPAVVSPSVAPPRPPTRVRHADTSPAAWLSQPAAPTLPLDDAYKLLKATAGSTWETIEQTRRRAVQQSSPFRTGSMSAEERSQVLAEAKLINAAYATLSKHRTGPW